MLIYLSGGFYGGWQDRARALLPGHEFVDPRDWAHLQDPALYAPRDLDGIDRCDAVLACMEASNPGGQGLCVELGYAHARGKPIALADLLGDDPRARYFGMARAVADVVHGDLEGPCRWLGRLGARRAARGRAARGRAEHGVF